MTARRILYVNEWGKWGGGERVTYSLIERLDRRRFAPIALLGCDGAYADALRAIGVPVHFAPMGLPRLPARRIAWPVAIPYNARNVAASAHAIVGAVDALSPAIIHTCSVLADIAGAMAARRVHAPLLWHVQNIQPPGVRRAVVRWLAKRSVDKVVATSRAVAKTYAGAVESDALIVNHAGYDPTTAAHVNRTRAGADVRRSLALPPGTPLVASVSMLRPWKGQHVLIDALPRILERHPTVIVLVVGAPQFAADEVYRDALLAQARALGVEQQVRFLGHRDDVPTIISAAACFVHCPVQPDPLPNVVFEAMAAGTPIVASAVGGIPEQVDEGRSGYLVPPGDHVALADRIAAILDSPVRAATLAAHASALLRERFSVDRFVARFHEVYAELLC